MSLTESKAAIRERIITAMDRGRIRETPGAVVEEVDNLTAKILKKITGPHTRRYETRRGLQDIVAASIVEEELKDELRLK